MFKPTKSATALIKGDEDPWRDDPCQNIIAPVRPPLVLGDLRFELALQGESPTADFGEGELLGGLKLLARDGTGSIVSVDLDQRFPGDFESDPDYQRLLRYTEVAVDEAFGDDDPPFVDSSGPWTFDGLCFECPPVYDIYTCLHFPLEKLRFWTVGSTWDGVTRVSDALASGELAPDVWARCEPALRAELHIRAVMHCLLPIPEREALAVVARQFYEQRLS